MSAHDSSATKETIIDKYGLGEDVDPDTKRACTSVSYCCC